MNGVAWPSEVCYDRHGTGGESFEHHSWTIVANRRKHKHVGLPQLLLGFIVADPSAERNGLVDAE
jgi:hypothetical protein